MKEIRPFFQLWFISRHSVKIHDMNMNYSPFTYCPGCGKPAAEFFGGKHYLCPECGFDYFQNNAAAAGIILHDDCSILVTERNMEPGKGMLGLPGGFIDPGESAEEGALRECFEETGIQLAVENLDFVASRPNVYTYKGISYHTCDIIFEAYVKQLPLTVEPRDNEARRIFALPFNRVNTSKFAFPSLREVVRIWLEANT